MVEGGSCWLLPVYAGGVILVEGFQKKDMIVDSRGSLERFLLVSFAYTHSHGVWEKTK